MNKEEMVEQCINDHTEDEIQDRVEEAKHDFVDDDDIEEHGDIYEAYVEVGRGEAETQVMQDVMKSFEGNCELDLYCEVWDNLCEEWNISTN